MKYFSCVILILLTLTIVQSYYNGEDFDLRSKSKYNTCPIIGIDLGMTHSCVGIWNNGQVDIIKNQEGNTITPSVVSFFGQKILVGKKPKNINQNEGFTTIYDVKRFIGKSYNDFNSHYSRKGLSYQILDQNQKPNIKIDSNDSYKILAPQQISAIVLQQMKRIVQKSTSSHIQNAIITVPAYFNNQQRQATKQAAKLAGLNVIRILNQPTAAAIAYGLDKHWDQQKILVIDLGFKTFDVSALISDNGVFEIVGNNGDVDFGGQKFNQILLNHFVDIFKIKFQKDISENTKAIMKLKKQIQKAKIDLFILNQTKIQIKNVIEGYDFSQILTRAQFEQINIDLFNHIINQIQTVFDKSQFIKQQINHIVLVGKDTRIPKIKQMFKQFFNNSQFHFGINPNQIKCYGAAINGNFLCNQHSKYDQQITLIDVTIKPIGVEVEGFMMQVIFPQKTAIPYKKTKTFTTTEDNQTNITIKIYEGIDFLTKYNSIIGVLDINNIHPAPLGQAQIQVTFQLTYNSNLLVSAVQKKSGKSNNITIIRGVGVEIDNRQESNTIRQFTKYEQQQHYSLDYQYLRDQL